MTITEAVTIVMEQKNVPMEISEIYDSIIEQDLYEFHSNTPEHIVRVAVRRRCKYLDFKSSRHKKIFTIVDGNKYCLLGSSYAKGKTEPKNPLKLEHELRNIHEKYCAELKKRILNDIRKLKPVEFEYFSKKMLDAYELTDTHATRATKDGGIDGYGKLNVGLAQLNVAFQSKKWKGNVGRTEIDRFRGAIQGEFEMGVFFTPSKFNKQAVEASFKSGAVPIILVDGDAIFDIMIEKQAGVQVENLPIYSYALDVLLSED